MEYASWLAGEKWSDHPACTHPALASLARMVNDCSSDAARSELVTHIPSVVGLNGTDPYIGLLVAARAASVALPIASEGRQRALAAGILRCDELLAISGDPAVAATRERIAEALRLTPGAAEWAHAFLATSGSLNPRSTPLMTDAIIRTAVVGIAEACVTDQDARLRALLVAVIGDVQSRVPRAVTSGATSRQFSRAD
ncbi:hypothetical protein [Lacisediminihabitans profunda]|uniref:Uncharacterized protein n=1 Tax=Lacisediminihabitans profunda TaxID=2594790 RepID=A0A5C8UL58_9MICO|nr:hypothetical protein [Lacisediminihabitans profunda]TXN28110.1 hypothetical protein FVP33_18370 [Lacisediminihabitans profunda]